MSLVSDVENALAGIATALPDAVRTMEHGAEAGTAIKASSVEMSGETASESGAVEKSRVVVTASDFPSLGSDDLVYLEGVPHVVTSLRTDPVGASATVGLSDALTCYAAVLANLGGTRRGNFPLNILAEDNGLAEDYSEGFAPTKVHSWTVIVAVDAWPEVKEPQIGDELRFEKDRQEVRLKVARCNRRGKHFVLNARSR